ncbi:MAG: PLP-dependent aminotransferase family protein [Burkholderiaceae bacterium]
MKPADALAAETFRYESLAQLLTRLIDAGTLEPGTKAPSLRQISRTQGVSVTTALQAYRLLESRGILEALPRSGFYVRSAAAHDLPALAVSKPPRRVQPVTAASRIAHMAELGADPNLVPLGCAVPSPKLLASSKLDRFLARAARNQGEVCNTYSPPRGEPRLRQAIAHRSLRCGQEIDAENIVITSGCTEALHLALKVATKPGDTVAIESPTYFSLLQILQSLGLRVLELPTDPLSGVSVAALKEALEAGTISTCLFASSFGNPLGNLTPERNKRAIIKLLKKHRATLIEDDVYSDIYFGSDRPLPYSALDATADIIYCSSFSKTLAPGYRIGWVSCKAHISDIVEHKFALTLANPVLTQVAMADYLTSGAYDNHLRRIRRQYANAIDQMRLAVAQAFPVGTRVSRPAGGFVLWLELPTRGNSLGLFDAAIDAGICFAPGDIFTASKRYGNCLRLSCGHLWDTRIERAVWKLGELATLQIESSD